LNNTKGNEKEGQQNTGTLIAARSPSGVTAARVGEKTTPSGIVSSNKCACVKKEANFRCIKLLASMITTRSTFVEGMPGLIIRTNHVLHSS
jgi:hypothetical protein